MDDEFKVPPKPWTGASIKALRDEIVRGGEEVPGLSYQTVYVWYSRVLLDVVDRLGRIDYVGIIGEQPEISFRVKTVDTLRDKLIRQDSTPLYRIHDIIGARVTASMTLQQQNDLVQAIAALFPKHQISDMREHPHSGYRAVHVIAGLPRGIFAEIQIRTLPQDAWANCYEVIADRYGREIRYGKYPDSPKGRELVQAIQGTSDGIRSLELLDSEQEIAVGDILDNVTKMMRHLTEYYHAPNPQELEKIIKIANNTGSLMLKLGGEHGRNGDPVQPEDR